MINLRVLLTIIIYALLKLFLTQHRQRFIIYVSKLPNIDFRLQSATSPATFAASFSFIIVKH